MPVARGLWLRDELLELVEAFRPAVPMELAASLRLERPLGQGDLRRVAEIPKRQLDDGLDVVGIRWPHANV